MANQKISELTQTTSLSGTDLIPIAHLNDSNVYETLSASFSDIKSDIAGSSGAITKLLYSDEKKAIYTSGDTLYLYDDNNRKIAYLDTEKLAIGTSNDVEAAIKLQATQTVAATTTTAKKGYTTKFNFTEPGFRITREEKTGANETKTGAWQLRMNSLDTYLYSKNHVEITAGSKTIDPDLSLSDLLTSSEADRNVRINLLSGGDIMNTARDAVYFTTPVFQVQNANEDAVFTITATDTTLVDASGDNILSQHYDSTNTANNTLKISRGGANDVLTQDKNNTYLYDSDGDNFLTAYYDGSDSANSTVTFQTNTFQVKSYDGNTLLFDNSTITNLVTTVANKENATLYLSRSWHNEWKATYTGTNAKRPTVPIMLRVLAENFTAQGTLLSLASFDGKISFWIPAVRKADNTTYTDAELQAIPAYLIWTNAAGEESSTPIYYKVSEDAGVIATAYDLIGKQTEVSFNAEVSYRAIITNGTPRAANVLHTVGDETAAGVKTFTSGIQTSTIKDASGNSFISVSSGWLSVSRAGADDILTQDDTTTYLNNSIGDTLLCGSCDSNDATNNVLNLSRGGNYSVLYQTKTDTTLYDSNGVNLITHTVGSGVQYSADGANYFKLYNNVITVSQPVTSSSTIKATGLAATVQTLTDAASIAWNAATGSNAIITLTAAGRTLANPTNIVAGTVYRLTVTQDTTGSRTITTWGSYFKFPGGVTPTLTSTASACDVLEFYADTTTTLRLINFIADSK